MFIIICMKFTKVRLTRWRILQFTQLQGFRRMWWESQCFYYGQYNKLKLNLREGQSTLLTS